MIIYVDASVIQTGNGTKENPFKTIQEAAAKALPGDEVIVAPGLYREAVNPIHAGTADKRITPTVLQQKDRLTLQEAKLSKTGKM